MTHLHLVTLGQCLISLARQAFKDPLYHVLRFVDSGAVIPNAPKLSFSQQKSRIDNSKTFVQRLQNKSKSIVATPKKTDLVKVSLEKSRAILDQINEIQLSQPKTQTVSEQEVDVPPQIPLPKCSKEEQYCQSRY